jgi:hypothetical protein
MKVLIDVDESEGEVEKIAETINGLQHIGCLQTTWRKRWPFTKGGLLVALRTVNEAAGETGSLFAVKELMIEAYQTAARGGPGCDHIALDVAEWIPVRAVRDGGYELLDDAVRFLPFWARGVRFFTILGPNGEKVEFSQKL